MTVAARDPWADARQVVTQPVRDRRLAVLRRTIWIRRVAGLVVACAVLLVAIKLVFRGFDDAYGSLWSTSTALFAIGTALMVSGFVLVLVGAARSQTKDLDRPFVGRDAYLPRSDRVWARQQIAAGRAVGPERHDVVTAIAGQMRAEGNQVLVYLGLCAVYVGWIVAGPNPSSLVVFGALITWLAALSIRATIWSRRARRWLALHREPGR